jgi:hypothetical protein
VTSRGGTTNAYNLDGTLVAQTSGETTRYAQDLTAPLSQVLSIGTTRYIYGRKRLAAQSGSATTWYTGDVVSHNSGCREIREWTNAWELKAQNNLFTGNARGNEQLSNPRGQSIVLDPNRVVAQPNVNRSFKNALFALPPNIKQLVVVALAIGDNHRFDLLIEGDGLRKVGQQCHDGRSPGVDAFHSLILSATRSMTSRLSLISSATTAAPASSNTLISAATGIANHTSRSGSTRANQLRYVTY